jgi:hypothetical protein
VSNSTVYGTAKVRFGEGHPVIGFRVKVILREGVTYGLARVRFGEGHRYAGHYEVQRAEAAAILVPFESVEPGPSSSPHLLRGPQAPEVDQAPPGVEFPDSREPYRPVFAEPGVKQSGAKVSGANVIFPGDYALLRDLVNEVEPGWSADWFSHGCNEFRGVRQITGNDGKRIEFAPAKWQGWSLFTGSDWPKEGDDFTVRRTSKGVELTKYDPDNAYCGGRAARVTVTFRPPSRY